jgi:hypothetical protein
MAEMPACNIEAKDSTYNVMIEFKGGTWPLWPRYMENSSQRCLPAKTGERAAQTRINQTKGARRDRCGTELCRLGCDCIACLSKCRGR